MECNIVEGYALGTTPLFRRHLRIAIGSAAETESLVRTAMETGYLTESCTKQMVALLDEILGMLFTMMRRMK